MCYDKRSSYRLPHSSWKSLDLLQADFFPKEIRFTLFCFHMKMRFTHCVTFCKHDSWFHSSDIKIKKKNNLHLTTVKERSVSAGQRGEDRTRWPFKTDEAVRAILRHRSTEGTCLVHCPNFPNTTVSIRDNCLFTSVVLQQCKVHATVLTQTIKIAFIINNSQWYLWHCWSR